MSEPAPIPSAPLRRSRHWSLRLLIGMGLALLVLLIAVASLAYYAFATPDGLRFALAQAERFTNGLIHVGRAEGRLSGELDLFDVRYAGSDGTVVTIKHVHLSYTPRALLTRRLSVQQLDVDLLDVTPGPTRPHTGAAKPTQLPARLPVNVVIDSLTLDAFRLHPSAKSAPATDSASNPTPAAAPNAAPDAAPSTAADLVIEQVQFAGQWLGDTIDVKQLTASLALTGPLQANARARMAADHIDFEHLHVQGPGIIDAKGRFGIETAASDLSVAFEQLQWPFVQTDAQKQAKKPLFVQDVHGELQATGRLDAYHYNLSAQAFAQGRAAMLASHGSGSLKDVQIDQLQLDTLPGDGKDSGKNAKAVGQRGSIQLSGHVAWAPVLKADLVAELAHVDPSLFAAGVPGDINGRLDTQTLMTGDQPDITFKADLQKSSLRGQPFSLTASGSTDTRRVQLKDLLLKAGMGSVQAKGEVAWLPRLSANVDATIAKLDPALFAPGWTGDLNGLLSIKTAAGAQAPIGFEARIADSKLRGYPVKLDAAGMVANVGAKDMSVRLDQLRLASGSNHLDASGQVTPPFDVSGKFDGPDLAGLYPKLSGHAQFDFKLAGTIEEPHLVTTGDAAALHYDTLSLKRLAWTGDLAPKQDSKFTITATDADVGLVIRSAKLQLTGQEQWHRLELNADTERGKANLALEGGFDRKRFEWGGVLAALGFTPDGMAGWSLANGAGLLLGSTRRSLENSCLQGADGRACFRLEQNVVTDGTRVGWNIERLGLSAFQPFLPSQTHLSGSVDGDGQIDFTGGDIVSAMAALNLHDAKLEVPDAPPLVIETGSLRADQRDGRLHGTAELKAPQGVLSADVSAAPGSTFNDRALSGTIKANFPSLAFLEPLLPQVRSMDGRLDGNVELAGTPRRPRFVGDLVLADAHARLVAAGIDLKDVQIKATAPRDGPIKLDGTMRSGDGTMHLTGVLDLYQLPLFADLSLEGDNFQVMNTAQARAWVSPKLRLVRDAKGATLTGELLVPRADITPKGFGGGGVDVSPDQVLVGAEVPPPQATLPVYADLRLELGNKVQIEGFGLKTRIEGAVNVTQEPKRGALARGELRLIDGHYKAYGQDLNIETGKLLFTGGPVTTPAVDIYATRKPRDDITVGVRVRGTLAKPELTLQSSPTLPREQQLSWLVLGRSLETSSTQDRSLVSSAALSLGLGGGDYLAGLLGKKVGLDELSVGGPSVGGSEVAANSASIAGSQAAGSTTEAGAQAAQLTLGKYLTPRLFVSYGISLFQQGYSFRLLYTLGRGFKLSTESGTASGGDIIYTTERGLKKKPAVEADPSLVREAPHDVTRDPPKPATPVPSAQPPADSKPVPN